MDGTGAGRRLLTVCSISALSLALAGPLVAQTLSTSVTEPAWLYTFPTEVRGLSCVGYDNDGLQDVFLVGAGWYPPPERPRLIGRLGLPLQRSTPC